MHCNLKKHRLSQENSVPVIWIAVRNAHSPLLPSPSPHLSQPRSCRPLILMQSAGSCKRPTMPIKGKQSTRLHWLMFCYYIHRSQTIYLSLAAFQGGGERHKKFARPWGNCTYKFYSIGVVKHPSSYTQHRFYTFKRIPWKTQNKTIKLLYYIQIKKARAILTESCLMRSSSDARCRIDLAVAFGSWS